MTTVVSEIEKVRSHFAERSVDEWVTLFDRNPDTLVTILRDIAHKSHWEKERRDGRVRTGRRPNAIGGKLEDLYRLIAPELSSDPFPEAYGHLGLGSLRQVARACPGLTKTRLHEAVSGLVPPDMRLMELISDYAGMSPAYFLEWRRMYVLVALDELFRHRPEICIGLAKAMGTLK